MRYVAEPSGAFRERYLKDADEIADAVLTMTRAGGIRTVRIELGDLEEATDTELSWYVVIEYIDL